MADSPEPRQPYLIAFWITNAGPYARTVSLTIDEAETLEDKIKAAEARGALYDWAMTAIDVPMSYAAYLAEAEILADPAPAEAREAA